VFDVDRKEEGNLMNRFHLILSLVTVLVLCQCAQGQTAQGDANTVYLDSIEVIPKGRFFDLDTGGVFSAVRPVSGIRPEIEVTEKGMIIHAQHEIDIAMKDKAQWLSDEPWIRVKKRSNLYIHQ
jgi:hypothetical protein